MSCLSLRTNQRKKRERALNSQTVGYRLGKYTGISGGGRVDDRPPVLTTRRRRLYVYQLDPTNRFVGDQIEALET